MAKETRTYADRREYLLKAISDRRRRIKEKAIRFMGGECQVCGYHKYQGALDFHHIDPSTKSFGIGGYRHSRSWDRVKKELAKCILVCANCHREIGAGIVKVPSPFTENE